MWYHIYDCFLNIFLFYLPKGHEGRDLATLNFCKGVSQWEYSPKSCTSFDLGHFCRMQDCHSLSDRIVVVPVCRVFNVGESFPLAQVWDNQLTQNIKVEDSQMIVQKQKWFCHVLKHFMHAFQSKIIINNSQLLVRDLSDPATANTCSMWVICRIFAHDTLYGARNKQRGF